MQHGSKDLEAATSRLIRLTSACALKRKKILRSGSTGFLTFSLGSVDAVFIAIHPRFSKKIGWNLFDVSSMRHFAGKPKLRKLRSGDAVFLNGSLGLVDKVQIRPPTAQICLRIGLTSH